MNEVSTQTSKQKSTIELVMSYYKMLKKGQEGSVLLKYLPCSNTL